MRIALVIVAIVAALCAVIIIIGYMLPAQHRASRQAAFDISPDTLFAFISDVEHYPSWRSTVKRVELLPAVSGKQRFREIGDDGTILYEADVARDASHRITRIADTSLPFGGSWTYVVSSTPTGSTLRITEDGEVYNPVFRFMARFVFSHTRTIDTYLRDAAKHFGAPSVLL